MGIELRPFIDQGGTPDTAGYRRPEEIEFDDGTSLARYMPGSVGDKHMRGVVIPHAKPYGGSRAYDPQKPPHKRVHIDPHIEGQSVVVDLEQITQEIAQEAIALGQEYADKHADSVHGVDQIRLRSAAAFHLIGASQKAHGVPQPVKAGPQIVPVQNGTPEPTPVAAGPRTIKAASFNGAPAQPAAPMSHKGGLLDAYQKQRTPTVDVAPSSTVGPPTQRVTFGVPGFGLHEACYHKVIISDQLFILVYDERYKGGGKYLPQIDGSFAARVEGDPLDYKLCWPGQMFTDQDTGRTYFQLLIEERVPQTQEGAGS
jgi:hypothetical protein